MDSFKMVKVGRERKEEENCKDLRQMKRKLEKDESTCSRLRTPIQSLQSNSVIQGMFTLK